MRKARLGALLQSSGDEEEDGLALDRILHGQSVIAKTGVQYPRFILGVV
jgi:hypothetical protein